MDGPDLHDRLDALRRVVDDNRAAADRHLQDVQDALNRVEKVERLLSAATADQPVDRGEEGPMAGPQRAGRAHLRDSGLAELFRATVDFTP